MSCFSFDIHFCAMAQFRFPLNEQRRKKIVPPIRKNKGIVDDPYEGTTFIRPTKMLKTIVQ